MNIFILTVIELLSNLFFSIILSCFIFLLDKPLSLEINDTKLFFCILLLCMIITSYKYSKNNRPKNKLEIVLGAFEISFISFIVGAFITVNIYALTILLGIDLFIKDSTMYLLIISVALFYLSYKKVYLVERGW